VSLASFFFDADPAALSGGKRLSPVMALKAIDTLDPIVEIPSDFLLCARVSLLLRGTSQLMAQQGLATALVWEDDARRALAE